MIFLNEFVQSQIVKDRPKSHWRAKQSVHCKIKSILYLTNQVLNSKTCSLPAPADYWECNVLSGDGGSENTTWARHRCWHIFDRPASESWTSANLKSGGKGGRKALLGSSLHRVMTFIVHVHVHVPRQSRCNQSNGTKKGLVSVGE